MCEYLPEPKEKKERKKEKTGGPPDSELRPLLKGFKESMLLEEDEMR